MSDEIEPREDDRVTIRPPRVTCDEKSAEAILDELGMGKISRTGDDEDTSRNPTLNDLVRLGAYVESSGVVPLEHGAILVTRNVMLRQMLRLEKKASECNTLADIKDITHAMGFLGDKIGKLSVIGIKTKVEAEVAAEEMRRKRQPSWAHGQAVGGTFVKAEPGSQVNLNGVAATPVSS